MDDDWGDENNSNMSSKHDQQELGLTIQYLAIENMHLKNTTLDCQKKLHFTQQKVSNLEAKLKHLSQDSFANEDNISFEDQIRQLQAEKEEDRLKIIHLTDQLNLSTNDECSQTTHRNETNETDAEHSTRKMAEMERFREDMNNRRQARHKALATLSAELERLRTELKEAKSARQKLEDKTDDELHQLKQQLANESIKMEEALLECKRLETANNVLTDQLKEESLKYAAAEEYSHRRIAALKDVASISKQMLSIRESQVTDLKCKVDSLQKASTPYVANDSSSVNDVEGLKAACSEQVDNIENLKAAHAEQAENMESLKALHAEQIESITKENERLERESQEKTISLEICERKCSELENRLKELEEKDIVNEEKNNNLQVELDLSCEERNSLSNEITLINSIFTQMLSSNSSTDMDLDKLATMLQENHDLITEMTSKSEGNNIGAGLPKLLLDLINQVDNENIDKTTPTDCATSSETDKDKQPCDECTSGLGVEQIASNLPKVWRVLIELLSHYKEPTPAAECKPSCYKCIETPTGPRFVPSVSNTYIRLKDLILEKKSLQKDLGKLKQLNSHLESKLHEQESRLTFVSAELKKTWGVVGKLRSQYRQLHTQEQILRYELQQKRHLLTELKSELEYCREKWERAREMNNKTEAEWKELRREFAQRKNVDGSNSGESGFSDDKQVEAHETTLKTTSTNSNDDNTTSTLLLPFLTGLKLQLHFFPNDIAPISTTTANDSYIKELLESIFSLPPIQVPDNQTRVVADTSPVIPKSDATKQVETKPEESPSTSTLVRTPEQVLAARAARLKRLEEQTKLLFNKVTRTTNLSNALNNRLEELHEQYGVPNPPPLPPTIPAMRIPTESPSPNDTSTSEEANNQQK